MTSAEAVPILDGHTTTYFCVFIDVTEPTLSVPFSKVSAKVSWTSQWRKPAASLGAYLQSSFRPRTKQMALTGKGFLASAVLIPPRQASG